MLHLVLGTATFATTFGLAAFVFSRPPLLGRPGTLAFRVGPPSDDYYLAYTPISRIAREQRVLYNGAEGTADHFSRADVLILGNSRLMFGLPRAAVDRFCRDRGLSYYYLGFGQSEADLLPLAIIRKFNLRPRLVIVNADRFFLNELGGNGALAVAGDGFEARRHALEGLLTYSAQRGIHTLVPHLRDVYGGVPRFPIYRSRTRGDWACTIPKRRGPIREGIAPPPAWSAEQTRAAHRFSREMASRGTHMVLTSVPSTLVSGQEAEQAAEVLRVPLIAPKLDGLTSFDNDHLDPASADRFASAFLSELARELTEHPLPARNPGP